MNTINAKEAKELAEENTESFDKLLSKAYDRIRAAATFGKYETTIEISTENRTLTSTISKTLRDNNFSVDMYRTNELTISWNSK